MAQSRRWSLGPTLDLESDRSRCFSHRDELDSSTASKVEIGRVVDGVLYIAHASYRDYVSQEVRPAMLVRESSTQLIRYSLDTCVRYSTYLLIFKSQKGSIEALNFLIITS